MERDDADLGETIAGILALLNELDPFGFFEWDEGHPPDEYMSEAVSIYKCLREAGSIDVEDVDRIWNQWFMEPATGLKSREAVAGLVNRVNDLYRETGRGTSKSRGVSERKGGELASSIVGLTALLNKLDPYGLFAADPEAPQDVYLEEVVSLYGRLRFTGQISIDYLDQVWNRWYMEPMTGLKPDEEIAGFVNRVNALYGRPQPG